MADLLERVGAALAAKYEVEREVGHGGMAHVFLARDLRHGRMVALKVLRPDLAAVMGSDRFQREIEIEASLQHPHILPLYESGDADGLLYYAMPFVSGESLRDRIVREKQLPLDDVVGIARDVAEAVTYANGQGVIHRDIKPENIMLTGDHALVTDFGIAHAVSEAGGDRLTTAGVAVGTPTYMSPEQATGEETIDARSDVYSLGLVVYEMLAGEPPFSGATPGAVLARQASERVPSLEIVRPGIPHAMAMVIEKALAKVPADRYQSAVAFAVDLTKGATGEVDVVRPRRRRRLLALLAAALLVCFALAIGWEAYTRSAIGLDESVIVLFPLEWSDGTGSAGGGSNGGGGGSNGGGGGHAQASPQLGEDAAFLIVAWLDGWGSFTWVNGSELLEDRYRANVRLLRQRDKSELAIRQRAAYYVDGRAIRMNSDSVRVALALHQARRARPFARADTVGLVSEVAQLGVLAAGRLVLSLLPRGETVDLSDVTGIHPQAIQTMVQAEREFHSGRFSKALELYRQAVEREPTFALAGARGAQAASWKHDQGAALELIRVALENVSDLAPRWAHFARGFDAYLQARADSAVHHFEQAIDLSETWAEGWMGLAETYQHLLPRNAPQDSLARAGFEQVYRLKPGYVPAIYHLAEFAMREGGVARAGSLLLEYRAADPEEDVLANLELALACVRDAPGAIDWQRHVLEDVNRVYQAGKLLGVGAAHPQCAMAGWQAVLDYDTTTSNENYLFSSLVGLQSMLVATGQTDRLRAVLDSAFASGSASGGTARLYYIVDAVAGAEVEAEARAVADSLRALFDSLSEIRLWFLAVWELYEGRIDAAQQIIDRLRSEAWADSRRAHLLGDVLAARVVLARGDTAGARAMLQRLEPSAPRPSLASPWESLGLERITLARLLYRSGDYDEAYRVAATLDSPCAASLIYPVFLWESLELRLGAARALGEADSAERIRGRLDALLQERM